MVGQMIPSKDAMEFPRKLVVPAPPIRNERRRRVLAFHSHDSLGIGGDFAD